MSLFKCNECYFRMRSLVSTVRLYDLFASDVKLDVRSQFDSPVHADIHSLYLIVNAFLSSHYDKTNFSHDFTSFLFQLGLMVRDLKLLSIQTSCMSIVQL